MTSRQSSGGRSGQMGSGGLEVSGLKVHRPARGLHSIANFRRRDSRSATRIVSQTLSVGQYRRDVQSQGGRRPSLRC